MRTYRINIGGRRILIPPRLLALNGGAPSLVARPRCDQGNPHTTITTVVEGEGAYITKSSTAAVPATVSRRDIITFGSGRIPGIQPKLEVSEILTSPEVKNSRNNGVHHIKTTVFPLAGIEKLGVVRISEIAATSGTKNFTQFRELRHQR